MITDEEDVYWYKAKVVSVYDGDTIRCDIDLGFYTWIKNQSIRLIGIDTPELRGDERPDGLVVKQIVSDLILDKHVLLKTYKDSTGKFGRWLAVIFYEGLNINQFLLDGGNAKPYNG